MLQGRKNFLRRWSNLQLVSDVAAACLARLLHGHQLDDQARPAGEVLRALALAGLRIVLLPGEARLLPALVDSVDQVLAQTGEEVCGLGLVGTILAGSVLFGVSIMLFKSECVRDDVL